ncbi:MAG TPA: nuclease [Acidobacteriaceae bacterium]|nr:nuclease [Acidobacteriaceae bacterium]
MRLELRVRRRVDAGVAVAMCVVCAVGGAQQLIGYVNTRDAEVAGASDVLNGQAVLTGSAAVTAREHTAPITLGRGGMVRVCQSSALHVTESRAASTAAPLLFSLDHGAIEIETAGTVNDSIMTPDLRLSVAKAGPLDLRLRVARNGDTCVENRGAGAPTLDITDAFGETMYQVAAGQHVLFEHGSLREVVDHEREPCGCPEVQQGMSVADALLASGGGKKASIAGVKAAVEHPFPAAISEGLAPAAEVPQAAVGVTHMQVADTLSYSAVGSEAAAAAVVAPVAVPAAAAVRHDPLHVVGRFFKRLFGG